MAVNMFENKVEPISAQQEINSFNATLLLRGSILITLTIALVIVIISYYLFHNYTQSNYSFSVTLLLALSVASYCSGNYCLLLFKRQTNQQKFIYFTAMLLTTTIISLSLLVNSLWEEPDAAKRILLIGFFMAILGWHSNMLVTYTALFFIVFFHWMISIQFQDLTQLDLWFSIIKFPIIILIYYFTVRKLLFDTKKKCFENNILVNKLNTLLHIDELTQINNRKGFNRDLSVSINTAHRLKAPLTLVILDIDYFKQYNDSLGHPQGDKCLTLVASVFNDNCKRAVDSVARIGGEEFAYILTGSTAEQASLFIKKLKNELRKTAIEHPQSSVSEYLTFSAGIAEYDSLTDDAESLYKKADAALYDAKKNGRDCLQVAQEII